MYIGRLSSKEHLRLSWKIPLANKAFFDINQAIEDAQESCSTEEFQDSLKRSRQACKKLETLEQEKDKKRFEEIKIIIKQSRQLKAVLDENRIFFNKIKVSK